MIYHVYFIDYNKNILFLQLNLQGQWTDLFGCVFRFHKFVGEGCGFNNTDCLTAPASSYPMPAYFLRCSCHLVERWCPG
jgi:hypothetical protein